MFLKSFRMGMVQRRRFNKLIVQMLMVLFFLIFILLCKRLLYEMIGYMPSKPTQEVDRNLDKHITRYSDNHWKPGNIKNILLWTPFFGGWSWLTFAQNGQKGCPVSCHVTNDKSMIESADAVLFHANDLWKYRGLMSTIYSMDEELPKHRTPNQVWIMFSMEPMVFMWGKIKPNTFNWTMLYRRESTVYNPFNNWYRKTAEELKNSTKTKTKRNYLREKTSFASTMVSNCKDQGKRYRTIRELKKYIDVDDFGYCSGVQVCPAGVPTTECGKKYLKKYKFYLAFENSYCRDYVSEKFWNALDRHQIPVIAAPDYNLEMLPQHSYLNVFDFPSIKDLANRMIEIGNNETLYDSYFDWMDDWKKNMTDSYCGLCKALHANYPAQSYHDMEGWIKNDLCYKSTTWSLIEGFVDRFLFDLGLS